MILLTLALGVLLGRLNSRRRVRRDLQWAKGYVESIVGDDRNRYMPEGWREAVRAWLDEPFPQGSPVDEIDEMHAQLAYWDYMVADVAIPLNEGRHVSVGSVDVPAGLRAFRADSARMAAEMSGDQRARLDQYRSYCELLEGVEALVRQRLASVGAMARGELD